MRLKDKETVLNMLIYSLVGVVALYKSRWILAGIGSVGAATWWAINEWQMFLDVVYLTAFITTVLIVAFISSMALGYILLKAGYRPEGVDNL